MTELAVQRLGHPVGPTPANASFRARVRTPSGEQVGSIWQHDSDRWIAVAAGYWLDPSVSSPMESFRDAAEWIRKEYRRQEQERLGDEDVRRYIVLETENGIRASAMAYIFKLCTELDAQIFLKAEHDGVTHAYETDARFLLNQVKPFAVNEGLDMVGLRNRTFLFKDERLVDHLVRQLPRDVKRHETVLLASDPSQVFQYSRAI